MIGFTRVYSQRPLCGGWLFPLGAVGDSRLLSFTRPLVGPQISGSVSTKPAPLATPPPRHPSTAHLTHLRQQALWQANRKTQEQANPQADRQDD